MSKILLIHLVANFESKPLHTGLITQKGINMNKLGLIEALATQEKITKEESKIIVELFFNSMTETLAFRDRVELRGLCSFSVKEYKGYTGRNPKTGEKVKIKPKKLPFFKCGRELRERVNYNVNKR